MLPNLDTTVWHVRVCDAYAHLDAVPAAEADALFCTGVNGSAKNSKDDESGQDDDSIGIPINIVTGVPGSGKSRLCTSIVSLAREKVQWLVLRQELDSAGAFEPSWLDDSLSAVVARGRAAPPGTKSTRVLLVTAGFTDIAAVVHRIKTHPEGGAFIVASVTCCVDPSNSFWDGGRRPFPTLLDQVALGWCNLIALTGEGKGTLEPSPPPPTASKESPWLLKALTGRPSSVPGGARGFRAKSLAEWLARVANPTARVMTAVDGRVTGGDDFEALLDHSSFASPVLARERFLRNPGWTSREAQPAPVHAGFGSTVLRFNCSLDRCRLAEKLKSESAEKEGIFRVKGRVEFDGAAELQTIHYVRCSRHYSAIPTSTKVCFLLGPC